MDSERERQSYGYISGLYLYLYKWKPSKDVFALKYFYIYNYATSSITSLLINNSVRRALKLRSTGLIMSSLPTSIIPSVTAVAFHYLFVINPLLKEELKCPLCLQLRSGCISFLAGIAYPMVIAPLAAMSMAQRYYTYLVPDIVKQPKDYFKLAFKVSQKNIRRTGALGIAQFFGGILWTYFEQQNVITVSEKLGNFELSHSETNSDGSIVER